MITLSFDERQSLPPFKPTEWSVFAIYTCEDCGWFQESRVEQRASDGRLMSTVMHNLQAVRAHVCNAPTEADLRSQAVRDLEQLRRVVTDAKVWKAPGAKVGDFIAFIDHRCDVLTAKLSTIRDDGTFTIETRTVEQFHHGLP